VAVEVTIRPIAADELPKLLHLLDEPELAGEFQWFGFQTERARRLGRRWPKDGLMGGDQSYLAVVAADEVAGWVTWIRAHRSSAVEIGIALFPEFRGRGIGTAAQQRLVSYLFATTTVHRIQAGTESGNVAEQRALEKAGFRREGLMKGWNFRNGGWRDCVIYGLTRDDIEAAVAAPNLLDE
jgi:RimJ/RimL family protein N-acetyltransferase